MFFLRNFVRSLLRFLFFVDRFSIFFNKMSAQTQPRVKKKRRNWSKGEDAVLMTKAITFYKLKEDEISKIFTKTMLVKETAAAGPQVRNYLIKKKKLRRKDQKTITETNVVEKWNELYWNALGWALLLWSFAPKTAKINFFRSKKIIYVRMYFLQ